MLVEAIFVSPSASHQIDPLGITGLRKVDILTVLVYYTERMHIKMSKANKLMRKVQEKPDTSFQGSPTPPQWSCTRTCLVLPAMTRNSTCEVLPTREACLTPGTRYFIGVSHIGR